MKKKKANGEGSIYPTPSGTFRLSFPLGGGKRYTKTFKTRKAAEEVRRKLRAKQELNLLKPTSSVSMRFLIEDFLGTAELTKKPLTAYNYKNQCNSYILPFFATYNLSEVSTALCNTFLKNLFRKNLSNSTRQIIRTTLSTIFSYAISLGYLEVNPVSSTFKIPKGDAVVPSKEISEDIVRKVLLTAKEQDIELYKAILITVSLGTRRGETLGFSWKHWKTKVIYIEDNRIAVGTKTIVSTPKTPSSKRYVGASEELWNEIKKFEGNASDFVVNIAPATLPSRLSYFLKKNALPHFTFRDLRHTHTSWALRKKNNVKAVAQRLGHSDYKMVMQVYAHVNQEDDFEIAESISVL